MALYIAYKSSIPYNIYPLTHGKTAFHRKYLHKLLIDNGYTDESQHANVLAELIRQVDSNANVNSKYARELLSGRLGLTGMKNTSMTKPEILMKIFNVSFEYICSEEEKFQKEKATYLSKKR